MKFVLIAMIIACAAGTAEARQARPNDFAYGMTITTAGREALNEFPIPDQMYRGTVKADLGDVCIFNAENEVVPFTLRVSSHRDPAVPETCTLPFFPLMERPEQGSGALSLRFQRNAQGSIVRVETADTLTPRQIVTGYLLDASSCKRPVSLFKLAWESQADGTMTRIRLEGSNDLQSWITLVPSSSIISLRYGDHVLEHATVDLGGAPMMKYYRLTALPAATMPALTGVDATLRAPGQELPRRWAAFPVVPDHGKPGEYLIDLGGHIPVDRIRIRLPQENTLVTATLFSRQTEREPWRQRARTMVYRLRIGGKELFNPDITLAPSSDRYRLIRIDTAGGGIGTGTPVVECGWIPGTVLFIARGSGPFRLAYGNAGNIACPRGNEELFHSFSTTAGHRPATTATTGPQFLLAGKQALRKPLIPTDWKTAVLWFTLLLGVSVLAWMAYKLSRQMQTSDTSSSTGTGKEHKP